MIEEPGSFRQDQFADAAAGAARREPYVVGDPEEACRNGIERAMREEQGVMASERLEFVRRGASAKPRLALSPVPTAVPPLGKPVEPRKRRFEPFEPKFELRRIARKFLSERHRRRVLKMGAT